MCLRHNVMRLHLFFFFFFNDTATTEIYTLSLHDALPIWAAGGPSNVAAIVVPAPSATKLACRSWLPCPLRHRGHERIDPRAGEVERPALLGAHVCGHQDFHDLQAVVEREFGLLLVEKGLDEVTVLGVLP